MKIIIYISNFNIIGGVETFTKNFCKRLSKFYDITLMYDNIGSLELLEEMKPFCKVQELTPYQKFDCDVFISSSAWGKSAFEFVNAAIYIQMVHADYRVIIDGWAFNYKQNIKTTHHVCVGETVKKGFKEVTKLKCDAVIHNLLNDTFKAGKKPKNKILNLITCSRLSGEKGFKRMAQLAEQLEEKKIDYVWNVWGNNTTSYAKKIEELFIKFPKVIFKGVTTEPFKEINKADYLVQLSDTEGFAYSVYEAMQVKTPCIITPFASGNEQIQNGVNGFIVPFEMDNIPFEEILKKNLKVPEFKELGTEKHWIDFLEKSLKDFIKGKIRIKIIAAVQGYKIGDVTYISKERADSAIERNLATLF